MKSIKYLFVTIVLLSFGLGSVFAQSGIVETEIKVDGVCMMCKTRIENAAYIKGVKFCEWNKETQMLKLVYNSGKVDLETIEKSVAVVGHSTKNYTADSIAYSKLPVCCAYQDGVEVH